VKTTYVKGADEKEKGTKNKNRHLNISLHERMYDYEERNLSAANARTKKKRRDYKRLTTYLVPCSVFISFSGSFKQSAGRSSSNHKIASQ
jgi:hypothetical protein